MREFTYQEYDTFYYRKGKLRTAAQSLMDLISGRNIDIRPYMQDGAGHYSEERTLATVEELLEALKAYLSFERAEPVSEKRSDIPESQYFYVDDEKEELYVRYEMEEDETACYRAFLYCALREIYADFHEYLGQFYHQTFGDLIDLAASSRVFRSYQEFLRQRYLKCIADQPQTLFYPEYDDSSDWFANCLQLSSYEQIRKEPNGPDHVWEFQSYYLVSDEEMEQLLQSLTQEQRKEIDRRVQEYWDFQKMEHEAREAWDERDAFLGPASEEELELMAEQGDLMELEREQFARSFVHPERYGQYLRQYLHLQHLRGSKETFLDAITGMVDFFLLAKGRSSVADPVLYKTIARVKQLTRQTEEMIARRGI